MELKEFSDLASTIITVGTPTVTVLLVFGQLKTEVTRLVKAVEDIQRQLSTIPTIEFRAATLEARVTKLEDNVFRSY